MKINKQWHLNNKMPKNATLEQRASWHDSHAKNCSCRSGEMPKEIQEYLNNRARK